MVVAGRDEAGKALVRRVTDQGKKMIFNRCIHHPCRSMSVGYSNSDMIVRRSEVTLRAHFNHSP